MFFFFFFFFFVRAFCQSHFRHDPVPTVVPPIKSRGTRTAFKSRNRIVSPPIFRITLTTRWSVFFAEASVPDESRNKRNERTWALLIDCLIIVIGVENDGGVFLHDTLLHQKTVQKNNNSKNIPGLSENQRMAC